MSSPDAFYDYGNISLGKCSIVYLAEVDVLVNPVAGGSKYLNSSGEVSKAFYQYGQEELQKQYEAAGIPTKFGNDVTITGPAGAICCKKIFHAAIGKYLNEKSVELLTNMIKVCLNKAEQMGMTSIAFPTVGCGKLGYDGTVVARCFIEAAKGTKLQIYIVAFTDEHFRTFRGAFDVSKSAMVSDDFKPMKPKKGPPPAPPKRTKPRIDTSQIPPAEADRLRSGSPKPRSDQVTESDTSNDNTTPRKPHKPLPPIPIPTDKNQPSGSSTSPSAPPVPRPRPRPIPSPKPNISSPRPVHPDDVIEMPIVHAAFAELNPEVMRQIQALRSAKVRVEIDPSQSTVTLFGSRDELQLAKQRVLKLITEDQLQLKNLNYVKRTRGVKEYLKALSQKTDSFPHYWNNTSGSSETKSMRHRLVCGSPAYSAVAAIVLNTWNESLATQGRDAVGLDHRNISIFNIWTVENPSLYTKYQFKLKSFAAEAAMKRLPAALTSLGGEKEVWTKRITGVDYLNDGLVDELNEVYLLHGTNHVDEIVRHGIDSRFCGDGTLFGKGAYFAESSTKSDQYADSRLVRSGAGQKLYMFVARVLLGAPFLCQRPRENLKRSPCSVPGCNRDNCTESSHPMSDSVVGTHNYSNIRLLFREFIVYEPDQCYPEFLVEYERI